MDRETRNSIQRATQAARQLVEHEYANQLEGVFDIRLDGVIATSPGEHLDPTQRVLRAKLVAAVEHQRTGGITKADAVSSYLRESAFTTLNRFVALKMLEARELVQECVSQGDQSAGFKEFTGLGPGLVQFSDHGYRLYIESLYDEIGREVRVLFDRRDPVSLLWPRRQTLLSLLAILNAPELIAVWGEDETIGWVYQYFNTDEERQQMRAGSQAPRNVQELAVRNQFFTPRYVVQFLTDNTLGRVWYEMRQGETCLSKLHYLIRRPNEVFLAAGEETSAGNPGCNGDPSHDASLKQVDQVPFRAKKDPRDMRLLDPACGSGHFLLYAFDLLLAIYDEAWADKASPPSELTGHTLREDYPTIVMLHAAVPASILRNNLHGIDIDARCSQIAALALWMRAQRAYKETHIPRVVRPAIGKTNIALAEPMPDRPDLQQDFLASLDPKLAKLTKFIFDRMQLAGVTGILLRLDVEIRQAVREIYGFHGELFQNQDQKTWTRAEAKVLKALHRYSESAADKAGYSRQLFAEDAARGLGFIALIRQRYDVSVMNPPFGDPPRPAKDYIFSHYGAAKTELYASFLDRVVELTPGGLVGCLSSRSGYFLRTLEKWRRTSLLCHEPRVRIYADLGGAVLDAAVECASVVVGAATKTICCIASSSESHGQDLISAASSIRQGRTTVNCRLIRPKQLESLPSATFAFSLPPDLLRLFVSRPSLADAGFVAKQGIGTSNNFRFLRLWWEVPQEHEFWAPYAKGGRFSPFFYGGNLVANWNRNGAEIKAHSSRLYGSWSKQITNTQYFGRKGLTYASRTHREIAPALLPRGSAFDTKGCCVFSDQDRTDSEWLVLLGYMNSRLFAALLRVGLARRGSGLARQYNESLVMAMPAPLGLGSREIAGQSQELLDLHKEIETTQETSRSFDPSYYHELVTRDVELTQLSSLHERLRLQWEQQRCFARHLDRKVMEVEIGSPSRELQMHINDEVGTLPDENLSATSKVWDVSRSTILFHGARDDNRERSEIAFAAVSLAFGYEMGRRWRKPTPRTRHRSKYGIFSETQSLLQYNSLKRPYLVDDPGAPNDCVESLSHGFAALGSKNPATAAANCALACLGTNDVRKLLREHFFAYHLRRYSSDKRKAPVYWQLATSSGSFSVWLYYHRINQDTLYGLLTDAIVPKIKHEERRVARFALANEPHPTSAQRKDLNIMEEYLTELRAFREEVARVAPLWNPNINDGVILNFAPLWRLVPQHKTWQKACKSVWDTLCRGDYDWAHLAMHLWPERVVPKCATDQSVAIAHGLEEVFWHEDAKGKWQPRSVDQARIDSLVRERTSVAAKDALKSLLDAPAPATGKSFRRKPSRTKGTVQRTSVLPSQSVANNSASYTHSASTQSRELLETVKNAIGAVKEGARKTDVISTTGITASEWNKAIKGLLADGSVTQTGQRRGARYHLRRDDG